MAISNALRVSIRIDLAVGDTPAAVADMSLPAGSSIADILDEVLELTQAPRISRPWVAHTAAGSPIDCGIPLSQTQVEQGSVVVLSPERDLEAPVVRDVAEALVELSSEHRNGYLVELMTFAGLCGSAVLLSSPAASGIALPGRIGIFAALCALLLLFLPGSRTPLLRNILPILIIVGAGVAVALLVAGSGDAGSWSWTWILLSSSCAVLVACLVVHVVYHPPLLLIATLATAGICLFTLGSITALWDKNATEDFSGPAATTVTLATIGICFAPKIAASLAGLRVPTLPTAGEDLSVSDLTMTNPDIKIHKTKTLFDAQILGITVISGPLILLVTTPATWTSTIFCLCIAVATLLHANRHQAAVPTWSLMTLSALSFIALTCSVARSHSIVTLIGAVVIMAVLITVALWISTIPTLEPTTIVWLERLESLCLAVSLPLALHLLDVFGMLRALDIGFGG
ncbi:hypothetical protein N24_0714 [Corynebacterium suranareeae]|uniref:EccD-like transmembrane domain-containing protein n=1 Tax=Corynebacterium suranareeae TaxID=2506452 RepID=A0A160PNL5_9CORY|nr:type VII secretion integral membrane protein EccD [Corynebacterium suranareeae]BAU94976.1 hypothetical protein N24_0714 [Corynebacterium suranareeae]